MQELRILSQSDPGYGFPKEIMERSFEESPDVLVCQGTSTDAGPYFLGTGKPFVGYTTFKKDMEILLLNSIRHDVTYIGSLIGSGSDNDLEFGLGVIDRIAREHKLHFKAAVISGEISKEWVRRKIREGANTRRLAPHPRLSEKLAEEDVERAVRLVSQMGPEPVMKALDAGVKFVFTGRALDVGLLAAEPLRRGFDTGLAYHMAKTLECGAMSASPPEGNDPMFAIMKRDHFLVRPPNPLLKCTPMSCAAHSFYERPDPFKEENPGGYLDLTAAKYEQYDERTVKVTGSKWIPTSYSIKIEGASLTGYRTITIAGVRCPVTVSKIDEIIPALASFVKDQLSTSGVASKDYRMLFRVYGKNGVMGSWETQKEITAHELCIIIDIVAKAQDLANDICALARSTLLHWRFPGRLTTAGNVAFPFSPSDIPVGEVYEFNVFHTIEITDPVEPFPFRIVEFPRR